MTVRHREVTTYGASGSMSYSDGQHFTSRIANRAAIEDRVPGRNQNLDIYKVSISGGERNGTWNGGWFNFTMDNFVPGYLVDPLYAPFQDRAFSIGPSDGALAAQLIADTNPSRPVVDLPVFVAELREFPQLFKLQGETLLKKAASGNLSYQFGWAPLIGDLKKLLDFSDHFSEREKELRALFDSGLRRKRRLFEGDVTLPTEIHYGGGQYPVIGPLRYQFDISVNEKCWGYVEWKPTSLPPQTNAALRDLARKAVLGLDLNPAQAWELIPFSWLVDWCSSAGDYLNSQRNLVGAEPHNILIMRHRTTTTVAKPYIDWDGIMSAKPLTAICDYKMRRRATPTISAHLPFLSLRQLSILGSIGILAGRQGRHKL